MIGAVKTAYHTFRGSLFGASEGYYRQQSLDSNRSKGERPYADLCDDEVEEQYVRCILRVRNAESAGLHLSPLIDRGWNLRNEWVDRGNDPEELEIALEKAVEDSGQDD